MARKPRKPAVDFGVYIGVRIIIALLQLLPLPVALTFGRMIGWLAYKIDKRHRKVAFDNLQHAFPDRCSDPIECDKLVRGCFRHFCLMVVEIAVFPRRLHVSNWRKYGSEERLGNVIDGLLANRPLLIVTAHFGNWEVAGYVLGMVGFKTFAIARVLDNPYLERFLKTFRQKTGQTILAKKGDFDQITEVLNQKGAIATLGDQDAGPRGMFVNFFNRPASTHKAVALLALQHDVPMVVVGIPRVGYPMKFKMIVEDVIDPLEYHGKRVDVVREMTERFTQAIERMVNRYPEQYFWLHRRWKHQPEPKKSRVKLSD